MDISIKQEKWRQERPLFEAEFIHSHLLPHFNFNESTGDYEIKSEVEFNEDEDRKLAYEVLNTGWVMWLRAKRDGKAQAVPEGFEIGQLKDRITELLDERQELYAQINAQAVPDGFVLVPEVLTHEQAARISDDENFFETYQTILTESDTSEDSAVILIQTAHKAMIEALEQDYESK